MLESLLMERATLGQALRWGLGQRLSRSMRTTCHNWSRVGRKRAGQRVGILTLGALGLMKARKTHSTLPSLPKDSWQERSKRKQQRGTPLHHEHCQTRLGARQALYPLATTGATPCVGPALDPEGLTPNGYQHDGPAS